MRSAVTIIYLGISCA